MSGPDEPSGLSRRRGNNWLGQSDPSSYFPLQTGKGRCWIGKFGKLVCFLRGPASGYGKGMVCYCYGDIMILLFLVDHDALGVNPYLIAHNEYFDILEIKLLVPFMCLLMKNA